MSLGAKQVLGILMSVKKSLEKKIDDTVVHMYTPGGSLTFDELPQLSADVLSYAYVVTDDFTTDSRFVEDVGEQYPGGTTVAVVDTGTAGSPVYKFDATVGAIPVDEELDIDSKNPVENKVVTSKFEEVDDFMSDTLSSLADLDDFKHATKTDIYNINDAIDDLERDKQDALTFDEYPQQYSENPIMSGGVYDALAEKIDLSSTPGHVMNDGTIDTNTYEKSGVAETLVKDTVGWSGKNKVKDYTVNPSTEQYASILYVDIDFEPSTTYTISFEGTGGNGLYTNEDLVENSEMFTVASSGRTSVTFTTKSTLPTPSADGYLILKNSVSQSAANVFTDLMIEHGSVATSYEPYHATVDDAKADKVTNATSGHLAGLDSNGNLTDSGVSPTELVFNKIYSFHIDSSESDSDACVTYLDDAVGMTPAYMDFANGRFNYGSWADAFFMPRPCMLKYDGTVDYYLDPNDYSKKEDGSPSDVADDTYGGNAMMEWGKNGRKIWYKVIPDASDATSGTIKIANYQVDSTYHAWSFINMQGNLVDHFYTPIYNGTIVDGKLRSISGKDYTAYCKSKDAPEEITAAEANNPSTDKLWYTEVFSDIQLINALLVLMGKSLDTQTVFGEGRTGYSWSESLLATTGGMDNKGLFYGESTSQGLGVKVFGMEHWWGNQWRRYAGHINDSGTIKIKLTYGQQDGSTVDGYNTTASGYLTVSGCTPAGTNGGYADKAKIDAIGGIMTYSASGSDQHYYSDGLWFNNGQRNYALRGGSLDGGRRCGAFCLHLLAAPSYRAWSLGAALSCKPLTNGENVKTKLDKSDVADVEGDTASKAYSVNDFMLRADGLYKVTQPIASGASITASNTTKTTVGEVLTALLNA